MISSFSNRPALGIKTGSILAILALSACGGGGQDPAVLVPGNTNTAGQVDGTPPTYENLASVAATQSDIASVGLQSNNSNNAIIVTSATGTLDHATGHLTVTDATYSFVSTGAFQNPGTTTDANGASITTPGNTGFSGGYDYVVPFNASYSVNAVNYDVAGIAGIATNAADMPGNGGTASYTGEAIAGVINSGGATELSNGTSVVTVDFADPNGISVTMNGFTATHNGPGSASTLTEIQITGMSFSGTSFSGGNVTYLAGNAPLHDSLLVGPLGNPASASGQFFGYDANISAPDEVAGVLIQTGSDGAVTASWIAD